MRIQISEACEQMLQSAGKFEVEPRDGAVVINENLQITTFWLKKEILP